MTNKEMDSLLKAMKKPEFHKLIGEYVDEISDPKNKQEYEQYLRQLEKQNELPPNTKLAQPKAGYCIKTTSKRHSSTKKNELIEQKVFINICSEESIDEVKETIQKENGNEGVYYSCPYMLSKGRPDKDKKGEGCMVYDVIFNPKAITLSVNSQFQKFICDTAINALNQYLGPYNEIVSHDYKLMKSMLVKGDKPALITIKIKAEEGSLSGNLKISSHQTSLQKEIDKEKEKASQKPEEPTSAEDETPMFMKNKPVNPPKVFINFDQSYIYDNDYTQNFEDDLLSKMPNIPSKIKVQFNLPLIESIQDIDLGISEKHLSLKDKGKELYSVKLSYPTIDGKISAKFDKTKKILVTLIDVDKEKVIREHKEQMSRIQESKDTKDKPELVTEDDIKKKEVKKEEKKNEEIKSEEKKNEESKQKEEAITQSNPEKNEETQSTKNVQENKEIQNTQEASESIPHKVEVVKEFKEEPKPKPAPEPQLTKDDVREMLKGRQCLQTLVSSSIFTIY